MSKIDWLTKLNWSDEQIDELRITGYAYIRQGKYEIALSFFEALELLDPESAYDAQTLGALYLQLGNPAKALPHFERALKLETDHSPTLLNLTKALLLLGRKEEGLRLANVLKNEKDPSIANTANALLLAYS